MKLKTVTASLLATLMLLTLPGCSKGTTTVTPAQNGQTSAQSTGNKDYKVFTGMYAVRLREIDDDNEIQQLIADKTGVILKQSFIADQDDIDKTFSDMMISNRYPDFMCPDAYNCQLLIKEGAFIPIDNYWDDYPNVKSYLTEKEWDSMRAADGHIYYIPLFSSVRIKDSSPTHSGEAFWIQVQVLEWGGYPKLETPDDYFDLIERFIAANPTDKNGEPWIGYEIEANDAWFFALDNPPMFLDGYPNDGCCIVDEKTLEAKDYNLSPTAKKWFSKLNEEYQKGIIDPECFLLNSDQYYQKIATGRVLGMVGQRWNYSSATEELPEECTYIPFGLTIDPSIPDRYREQTAFNGSAGVGISISCSDPDGAMKFLNDILDPEIQTLRFWGIEGVDYTVGEDGIFTQTEEQYRNWRDADYMRMHVCQYDYMPYWQGMLPDGINAYNSTNQANIYYAHLPEPVQKCFKAYGVETYNQMLSDPPPENPAWYPMWSFSNSVTDETDYGKVMKQIDDAKHKYLPLLVMSEDFEKTWAEYNTEYGKINSKLYFDELTAEVRRRVEAANK